MVKVRIPREAIEQITREYGVDEKTASQAFLDATDHAQEAFDQYLTEKLGGGNKSFGTAPSRGAFTIPIHTPTRIKAHLDKYVIGQEEYKKRLSIAASYHFAMLKYLHQNPHQTRVKRFRKKNTITAGPSGSGKTYCIEVLGDLLEVPTLMVDATDYTEAGYVGKSADDMIRELIDMAPGATRREKAAYVSRHGGLIFIDEIDKKAKEGRIGHDISREGFQRAVLKLIERKMVAIDNPYSPASQLQEAMDRQRGIQSDPEDNMVSTEKILFVLGGSFERPNDNLESIVRKRLSRRGDRDPEQEGFIIHGFSPADPEDGRNDTYRNYYAEARAEDYIRFGLIPELVGRSPIRTFVNLLSKNDLVRIMTETEDSLLDQYRMEFRLFDIDLDIRDEAIEYVAEIAENKRTGARALVSVWENILTEFQYHLPGSNFTSLVVDRHLCINPKDVILKMLERSPFVDFVESFRREYGVELILDDSAQAYVEEVARRERIQVSAALDRMMKGASALNYMNVPSPFAITREMLEQEDYFERLFTEWHLKQKRG